MDIRQDHIDRALEIIRAIESKPNLTTEDRLNLSRLYQILDGARADFEMQLERMAIEFELEVV